jgi:hypothetical protein
LVAFFFQRIYYYYIILKRILTSIYTLFSVQYCLLQFCSINYGI